MCGIFGVIAHYGMSDEAKATAERLLRFLAVTSSSRGLDSSGIATVTKEGNSVLFKAPVPSLELIRRNGWADVMKSAGWDTHMIMGHTRKKTHGEANKDNAHPFQFTSPYGLLIGSHNGQIEDHEQYGPKTAHENDSKNLLFRLSKMQVSDWPQLLKDVKGSYALAVARGDSVYLVRNTNPCWVATCTEYGFTAYASTEYMLRMSLSFARIVPSSVEELPAYMLHQYSVGRAGRISTAIPRVYTPTPASSYHNYTNQRGPACADPAGKSIYGWCRECKSTMPRTRLISFGQFFKCIECAQAPWKEQDAAQARSVAATAAAEANETPTITQEMGVMYG